ncbi:MAG TPA: DegQ family serine endoprotease [Dissulfurispiraceae bacterium]|nr:DegQ family serine endoprotease [Dissulfurispiraceae bacterium]
MNTSIFQTAKFLTRLLILVLFISIATPQAANAFIQTLPAANILNQVSDALASLAEQVKPSIVNISTSKSVKAPRLSLNDSNVKKSFGETRSNKQKAFSLGSGVISSKDGYIITCNHVIEGADDILVRLHDGREFKGKIVGLDSKTDIAVIKIAAEQLPAINWGDSARLRTGDLVIAIGNPFGLSQTMTSGIVSATGRAGMGLTDYEDFIQTDAAINPGNSGGALVNANGELIGINDAIFSTSGGNQGIGFAIPSNMIRSIMDSIISKGKVIRGYLGVQVQPLNSDLVRQFGLLNERGVLVVDVTEGSPADKAGLMRGDVITALDEKEAEDAFHLKNQVAATSPGKSVVIKLIRNGKSMMTSAVITELPSEIAPAPIEIDNALRGVAVQDLNTELLRRLGITRDVKGVIVTSVSENSRALGILKRGDVIMEVNRKPLASAAIYTDIVSKIGRNEDLLLLVIRGDVAQYLTLNGH